MYIIAALFIKYRVFTICLAFCKVLGLQLEKEMATHSNILAWRIPGTEKPGGLPSMGSHRVRHDWHDLAAAAAGLQQCAKQTSSLLLTFFISFVGETAIKEIILQKLVTNCDVF